MYEREILDLFKVMVVDTEISGIKVVPELGYAIDFAPTSAQSIALADAFAPIDIKTLFSVEERETADPFQLITKQIIHYIEVYGFGAPGLFELEVTEGKVITLTYVKGVTVAELSEMIHKLLYTNAPVKDADAIKNIINHYSIDFDINRVANNELRVILFDAKYDVYTSGDDAVRYICYNATQNALLIKSAYVISQVKAAKLDTAFFRNHEVQLAQVFNRHKAIILACKNKMTANAINKIGRLSKKLHVPIKESFVKSFISDALLGEYHDSSISELLTKISLRDKFKFLNLLEYKKLGNKMDAFIIRNGRIHIKNNRPVYSETAIDLLITKIVNSLKLDLYYLQDKTVLLDANVDYGLPISRKQTIGNLPFGTEITPLGDESSFGVHWKNEWGANDLDLSSIDEDGNRTGWGQFSGYDKENPVTFSGDVTSAPNGAMEFLTSNKSFKQNYGLFVNIYNGVVPSSCELVIGNKSGNQWIETPLIREKTSLNSRGNILGFIKSGKFIVYQGRLNGDNTSSASSRVIVSKALAPFWTIRRLLEVLEISFDEIRNSEVAYDHDLSYHAFTYDKLESMFLTA